jgi:hypothetical protein
MKIFHQAGHNTIWNIESFIDDNTGDGIIFSPVHFRKERFEEVDIDIRRNSLFDPQFYVPDSQKAKLQSYEFFPEVLLDGFSTDNFEAHAYEAATLCLEFQLENDFESLIVPARYFQDLVSDYIPQQRDLFVDPFLQAYSRSDSSKQIFLTLPMTSVMLFDDDYCVSILNWVTSYPEIHGVYLLVHFDETSKQIQSYDKLLSYTNFIQELQEAELNVICGYCNTEAILLTLLDVYGVSMGTYENTRGFSIDKFLENDQDIRGPAARIFLPNLLNWIRWVTADEIRSDFPELWDEIYTPTDYSEAEVIRNREPHFTQPPLYKHQFQLMAELFRELAGQNKEDRKQNLTDRIRTASELYNNLNEAGILFFDDNCRGDHLPVWNRLLRRLPPTS